MTYRLFILLMVFGTAGYSQTSEKYDLYYIAIGSSHYIDNEMIDTTDQRKSIFRNIQGANKSAKTVRDLLRRKSPSAKGIVLNSEEDMLISRKEIMGSVDSLRRIFQPKKSRHPFLVFYYCGHGISEVASNLRFLIPGNMVGDVSKMHVDEKKSNAVCVNDLYDSITQLDIPFILILDCCADKEMEYYEGMSEVFTGTAINNLEGILDVMKAWFMLQGDYPVICSAGLGESTFTVQDPNNEGSIINIGPVCRRMLLTARYSTGNTLPGYVKHLVNLQDNATHKPVVLCDEKLLRYKRRLW